MFDPQTKKYYGRTTSEINLNVEDNPNAPSANVAVGTDDTKKAAGSPIKGQVSRGDVLPDVLLTWEPPNQFKLATSPVTWFSLYGFVFGFLVWRSKIELGWGRRRQSLRDLVQRRSKKLDSLVHKNDYRALGAEMMNIFNLVLGSISGHEASGLELERMLEQIAPSLRREFGEAIKKQYEIFQLMSFAPEDMLGVYKEKGSSNG